jgi:putative transport protein
MVILDFLNELFTKPSIAQNLIALALTISVGLTIGRIHIGRISIGVAGVLFAGILLAQLGIHADHTILDFVRELGLIIFVYTIGVQVGPRFISNFKNQGVPLNMLAISTVLLSVLIAFMAFKFGGLQLGATIGILSGGTTNTPSLGAAQAILAQQSEDAVMMSTLGYAVSYPMGIFGIILTMLFLKKVGKISIHEQAAAYTKENSSQLMGINIKVENKNINGIQLSQIPDYQESLIVYSRIMHQGEVMVPKHSTTLHLGDIIRAVGPKENIKKLQLLLGSPSEVQLQELNTDVTGRRVLVTRQSIVGRTIQELQLRERFGVIATRISHDDYELPAAPNSIIYYGDSLWIVGESDDIEKFAKHAGDSPHDLNHPFILPIFLGMVLGIIVGQIPIPFPGIPSPVKIGLAGGPLLVAIFASRMGRFGHVVWYMPTGANLLMRKFGISMFLAAVSLKSGGNFIETVMSPQGLQWFLWGCAITIVPLIIVGSIALWKMRINYLSVCGLLAGSLTDPPALAFANGLSNCSAQSVAYSTIYPVVMLMRIISAQVLAIILIA